MNLTTTAVSDAPSPFQPVSSPDFVPRELLRGLQTQRLQQAVGRCYEHVPLYRQRMQKLNLTPVDVRGIDDLAKLPFTQQADLCDAYPLGMLAVPLQHVACLHPLTDIAAGPMAVAMTAGDLATWTEVIVRCLACCGIHSGDVILSAWANESAALESDAAASAQGTRMLRRPTRLRAQPAVGFGLLAAAEVLGATLIAGADIDAAQRIAAMKHFGVSVVCSTPAGMLRLVEQAAKMEVDLRDLPLRAGLLVGETPSESMCQQIEQAARIKTYRLYGPAEILGLGAAAECCSRSGLHVFEDHFYPEIVDPATGQTLADGQQGELVLTTLTRHAMPLIRYRTGDLTAMIAEPCPCGRSVRRIGAIGGRSGETALAQGAEILPSQIEAALRMSVGTLPEYQVVLTHRDGLDQIEVHVEVTAQIFSDRVGAMEDLQSRLAQELEHALGIAAVVRLVEPKTIERTAGTAQRIVDKRNG